MFVNVPLFEPLSSVFFCPSENDFRFFDGRVLFFLFVVDRVRSEVEKKKNFLNDDEWREKSILEDVNDLIATHVEHRRLSIHQWTEEATPNILLFSKSTPREKWG